MVTRRGLAQHHHATGIGPGLLSIQATTGAPHLPATSPFAAMLQPAQPPCPRLGEPLTHGQHHSITTLQETHAQRAGYRARGCGGCCRCPCRVDDHHRNGPPPSGRKTVVSSSTANSRSFLMNTTDSPNSGATGTSSARAMAPTAHRASARSCRCAVRTVGVLTSGTRRTSRPRSAR